MPRDSKPVEEPKGFSYDERVAELVEAALARDPSQRAQFVENACENDAHLRAEVESLLRFQEKAQEFIEAPAYRMASEFLGENESELKPGQVLGEYKILSLIGEGGMGEVYL